MWGFQGMMMVMHLRNESATVKITKKKKLTQAKNATPKNAHCLPVIILNSRIGFGAGLIAGFSVVNRVLMYWPTDMPWCGACSWPFSSMIVSIPVFSACW